MRHKMHDMIIRNGLVVDGSGGEPFHADIAIDAGKISQVGNVSGQAKEEIDAAGCIVTPGFVDLHTHYDAQIMWDPILAPSAWHGVTTVVIGNCAVGFAPVHQETRSWVLRVMESVEEIPVEVMEAGIPWEWETYPEYLDALDRRQHTIDIATQVPHISLRAYVMGERAERGEAATAEDVAQMTALAEEALSAGAIGLSCSRTTAHKMSDGSLVPGSFAPADEILEIAGALARVPGRVMQYLGDVTDLDHDLPLTLELARRSQSPIHFIMSDTGWRQRIATIDAAGREGLKLVGHVAPRGVGMVTHWLALQSPFSECPSFQAIEHLPWEDQLAQLKDPDVKARIIAEAKAATTGRFAQLSHERMFEMSEYPDYEPDPATDSVAAKAGARGQDPTEYIYNLLMQDEGAGMMYVPFANYRAGDLSEVRELLNHPSIVVSLSDGGAHCTRICDAASPTFMLAHWGRDRTRGEKLPLQQIVKSLTSDTASSYGFHDRGLLTAGYLADLNIIDFDRLRLPSPYRAFDFPLGGQRLLQQAEGYVATIKSGKVTFRNGEHCGVFPGKILRGPQQLQDQTQQTPAFA